MKKITLVTIGLAALVCFTVTPASAQNLVLTGIFDGPLTGGVPKAIELYATGNISNLNAYGLELASNGGGSSAREYTFPDVPVSAGTFIYVAEATGLSSPFDTYFGFQPDYDSSAVANFNGDDAILLYYDNGLTDGVIDEFGDPDVDGTSQPWEYTNGWASRNAGTGPDAAFVIGNWTFSGTNTTNGCGTNASCGSVFPIATYPVELQSLSIE